MQRLSTLDPIGPLQCAISLLEKNGCSEEVAQIRCLLLEWVEYREDARALDAELSRSQEDGRKARKVAQYAMDRWRSCALIHQSKEDLARVDFLMTQYAWLKAA